MKIGDVSGCLEVVSDIEEAECEIKDIVRKWAEEEWNRFGGEFYVKYYEMDKDETALYVAKQAMPKSFVGKYRKISRRVIREKNFLHHKKKPDTYYELLKGFGKGKLFKVKCNICNRTFYTDEVSFGCVKWRTCVGPECLKTTIKDEDIDYSRSMYEWDEDSNALLTVDAQLAKVETLSTPLTYYGLKEVLHIAYISDIHLLHHLHFYDGNHKRMINDMTKKLYESMGKTDVIIFGGDTSSDSTLTICFYKEFMRRYDYEQFKVFKKELSRFKDLKKRLSSHNDSTLVQKKEKINKFLDERKKVLPEFYAALRKYKRAYYANDTYKTAWEYYKKVKSYGRFSLSDNDIQHVNETLPFLDLSDKYDKAFSEEKERIRRERYNLERFESKYGKSIKKIKLSDYKHVLLEGVYAVLGNHEFIGFPDIESGVSFYESELSKLGIKLLHNEYDLHKDFLIYGGTGFAKYNEEWNADSLKCCDNFSREDEITETSVFEEEYKIALEYAKENGLCFLCVLHYPVSDCLGGKYDKEAIYFAGHNHNNEYVKSTDKVLYADNQVGYKHNNVGFKIATTSFEINPYHSLQDGMYQTSIEHYLQFYRFIGESVGQGNLLYQRCQNGKAKLYVIKRKGYYGFFLVSNTGICIVNGGVIKRITISSDLSWICENFEIVISKYLQLLMPLRNAQEKISGELKELGFDGKIHGCILDIDFYHHIAVNPLDGNMELYYSRVWGIKSRLASFKDVMKSIEKRSSLIDKHDYKKIMEMYNKRSKDETYLLSKISDGYLIEMEDNDLEGGFGQEEIVSLKEGMYGVSRKISPLQRLFSGHVLRDFDLRLIETKLKPYRTYLYTNRLFVYEYKTYKVVEDDGSEIIIAEEVQGEAEEQPNEIVLTGKRRKFSITTLKNEIAKRDWGTYWITK